MYPDLIDLGCIGIKTYGACMAIGFLLAWTLIEKLSGRKDLSNLILAMMVSGVVGSRTAYVIEHWQAEFAGRVSQVIRVDRGGLMFYGGLILAVIVFLVWCKLRKERPLALADLFATVIPLGHACGRIGCFFFGCCYGRQGDYALAVRFPRGSPAWYEQLNHGLISHTDNCSLPVLPTQLFEAAALLVLFAVLLVIYRKCRQWTTETYFFGYALIRFSLEYLRGDPRAEVGLAGVGMMSISQAISLGMVVLAITILIVRNFFFRYNGKQVQ